MPRSKFATVSAHVSAILIAAHFVRSGLFPVGVIAVVIPWFLILETRWATRLVQGFLMLASVEWAFAIYAIAAERREAGEPWVRAAVILSSVIFFTLGSAWAIRERKPAPAANEMNEQPAAPV
jgi:hypothetical protein